MENASKALLMAAGVLIGILIISFMMLLLRKGGQMSSEYDNQLSDKELLKFNSQFEIYHKADNSFFDVITVVNLAYDVNTSVGWEAGNGVTVEIKEGAAVKYKMPDSDSSMEKHQMLDASGHQKDIYSDIIEKYTELKNVGTSQAYKYDFVCEEITYNRASGRVNKMVFSAKEK